MRIFNTAALVVSLLTLAATTGRAALEKELCSVCLVKQGSTAGTGTCFTTSNAVGIITAAHVASRGVVTCQFTKGGFVSLPIRGQVVDSDEKMDVSLVAIPRASFYGQLPVPVPLGTKDDLPHKGDVVDTVGCPGAAMPTGEKLRVIGYEPGGQQRLIFGPRPEHGRSGSAVFSSDGEHILALICGFYEGASVNGGGLGPRCDQIRSRFKNVNWDKVAMDVACIADGQAGWLIQRGISGGGCDNGTCPDGCRNQGGSGNGSQGAMNPWPQGAQGNDVNLGPLIERQDRQIQLIIDLASKVQSPPLPVPQQVVVAPLGPDAKTAEALNGLSLSTSQNAADIKSVKEEVKGLREELPKTVEAAVKPISTKLDEQAKEAKEVRDNISQHGTFLQRLQQARENVAEKDPEASKVRQEVEALRQAIGRRTDDGDRDLRSILIVGGLVAAGALVVWNVMHGKGLVRRIADNIAAQHPDNLRAQKVASFIDSAEDRFALPKVKAAKAAAAAAELPAVGGDVLGPALQLIQQQLSALHGAQLKTALATPAPGQLPPTDVAPKQGAV